MAVPISYPELAGDKFSGLGTEDPEAFINLVERKVEFSLGSRPADADAGANPGQIAQVQANQNAWDSRRKALFASLLRGPAAEWYQNVDPNIAWNEFRNLFINRFTDGQNRYRYRIDAENCKRQPDEQIKAYIHRVTYAVQKGWPNLPAAQRETKYIEYFVRGLSPIQLKQSAHKWLITHPDATWDELQTELVQKDLSFTMSATLCETHTQQHSQDKIQSLEKKVSELSDMLKENKINVVNDPNNRYKSDSTRFCKFCRRNGHSISFCRAKEAYEAEERSRRRTPERRSFETDYRRESSRERYRNSPRYRDNSNDRSRGRYRRDRSSEFNRSRSASRENYGRRERSRERYDTRRNSHRDNSRDYRRPESRDSRPRSNSRERGNRFQRQERSKSPMPNVRWADDTNTIQMVDGSADHQLN